MGIGTGNADEMNVDLHDTSEMDINVSNAGDGNPNNDDIKVEYHPSSGCESKKFAFEDFVRVAPDSIPPADPDPWVPFRTREDFEFAELALDAGMSKAQVNAMIRLFHRCIKSEGGHFTLSSYDEMHKTLDVASERLPKVCL